MAGLLSAYAADEVKGDGNIVSRKIDISDYDEVEIAGTASFHYTQSDEAAGLEITIDENLLPYVKIEVKNRKLTVGYQKGMNLYPTKNIVKSHSKWLKKVKVTGVTGFYGEVPIDGNELELKSAGNGLIQMKRAVKVGELILTASGSSNIVADNVQTESLTGKSSGAGNIRLGGRAIDASFSINGSGDIDAFPCRIDKLACKLAGSGNINATVTQTLKASILGSGNIRYKGAPAVTSRKLGSGSVEKAE